MSGVAQDRFVVVVPGQAGVDAGEPANSVPGMSSGLALPRSKKASRAARARPVKARTPLARRLKLEAEEAALHAAVSAAVARDLGR